MVLRLRRFAIAAADLADWHLWSIYGRRLPDGRFQSSAEACTEEVANWATELAERSFTTAEEFVQAWVNAS